MGYTVAILAYVCLPRAYSLWCFVCIIDLLCRMPRIEITMYNMHSLLVARNEVIKEYAEKKAID